MSTLEKTINLLNELPERQLEIIYSYAQFVSSQHSDHKSMDDNELNDVLDSIVGVLPDSPLFDFILGPTLFPLLLSFLELSGLVFGAGFGFSFFFCFTVSTSTLPRPSFFVIETSSLFPLLEAFLSEELFKKI